MTGSANCRFFPKVTRQRGTGILLGWIYYSSLSAIPFLVGHEVNSTTTPAKASGRIQRGPCKHHNHIQSAPPPTSIFRKNTHLTGLPDRPFSLYRLGRVNSMVPAMSICAQRIGASPPSFASIPSTNAFKNNAAVQLPPGLPPVCFIITLAPRPGGKRNGTRVILTLHRSALDE